MLVPILASLCLVGISAIFFMKTTEHYLKSYYGEGLYGSSNYIQDLSVYSAFTAVFLSTYFVGLALLASKTTSMLLLCEVLGAGYFITFRGILLTLFSFRFKSILKKRYGIHDHISFDGSTARCHSGGVPSYVASHLQVQMTTSNKVAAPIGVVWVIFIFVGLYYLPFRWINGLSMSGLIALYAAVACTILLLPDSDEDKPVADWKTAPIINALPAGIFLVLFIFLTPIIC